MEQYDVGIFGLWYGRNYGSISTYFALKTVVEQLGYSTVMIENPLNSDSLDIDSLPMSHPRRFARDHYTITPRFRLSEMAKLNDVCSAFLLGSDQMWNYGLSRAYKESYFLDFAADNRVKIAYATSFGKAPYNGPADYKPTIRRCLSRFTGLSVRDDFSLRILKEELNLEGEQVLDPVFLCPRSAYEGLISELEPLPYENYIFAYILDPNPEIGQSLRQVMDRSGKRIVIAFDESSDKAEMLRRLEIADERLIVLNDPPVNHWMACYRNADFVLTDSFHGACFSVIFQRPFLVLKNNKRGGGRFDCLLGTLGLLDRMCDRPEALGERFSAIADQPEIDYAAVEENIRPERERGLQWLRSKLSHIHSKAVTARLQSDLCVGCGACVSACPVDALTLRPDAWGYYRANLDMDQCINCGKCAGVCPALRLPENTHAEEPECYEFVSSDDEVLRRSSSGGVFTTLARAVFAEGGVIFGAAWKDDFTVEHIAVETEADLWKLQKSKYLQSYLGDTFRRVKAQLETGRLVLFTGTPCQVTGLRGYLGRDYENLLAVDIFCSNAPSAGFFRKYVEDSFPEGLQNYEFRYKKPEWNWDCVTVRATGADGADRVRRGSAQDAYQRVFHNHTMCSRHCETCRFQTRPRFGDLSMGDFWGISRRDPALETQKGVSVVLVNSEKGRRFFEAIPADACRVRKKVPLSWVGSNGYTAKGSHSYAPASRDLFFRAIRKMPFGAAVNFALKPNRGQFRSVYRRTNSPLQFDCNMLHFRFERNVWEELAIEGRTTLIVKDKMWRENGHYARLAMAGMLKQGKRYRISAKFKIHSKSDILNFHIIDSGSKQLQVVHTEPIAGRNTGEHWIEFSDEFVPNTDFYDEFMFGAAQISGPNNYLTIAYINVSEA